jgi:hypothetical protein
MKVPTDGTKVFAPAFEGNVPDGQTPFTRSTTGVVDLAFRSYRPGGVWNGSLVYSRLQGGNYFNGTASTSAESAPGSVGNFAYNNGWFNSAATSTQTSQIDWMFRRAPGFFDEVCYTGASSGNQVINHNLTVAPELIISKRRSGAQNWFALNPAIGYDSCVFPNLTDAKLNFGTTIWSATSTTMTLNASALLFPDNYVAYLFASCPGVSSVGSFTGTGATQVINCGFTGGARFVLIKATSTTGNWLVWDSARGIVAGNDPYLALNSTAAEVTNTDWVDTAASGFELSNAGGNLANSNGVSYVFLAVA